MKFLIVLFGLITLSSCLEDDVIDSFVDHYQDSKNLGYVQNEIDNSPALLNRVVVEVGTEREPSGVSGETELIFDCYLEANQAREIMKKPSIEGAIHFKIFPHLNGNFGSSGISAEVYLTKEQLENNTPDRVFQLGGANQSGPLARIEHLNTCSGFSNPEIFVVRLVGEHNGIINGNR